MKLVIELPDSWLDTDLTGNIEWIARTVKQEVQRALVDAIATRTDLPQLDFTAEELRPLVADKLAERKADELWSKS